MQEWVRNEKTLEKIVNDAWELESHSPNSQDVLMEILLDLLGDWNKYVIENTLELIQSLALKLKKRFVDAACRLFEKVFELYSAQKIINKDKIKKTLVALFSVAGAQQMKPIVIDKQQKTRNIKELLNIICYGLRRSDRADVVREIIKELVYCLREKDSQVKMAAVDLFGKVKHLFGGAILEGVLGNDLRGVLVKITESAGKFAKIQSLVKQKKELDAEMLKVSRNISAHSERSTASQDRQYFYVQVEQSKLKKLPAG